MTAYPDEDSVKISSPFGEGLGFESLIHRFGQLGREKRKLRTLFPRRPIVLKYEHITVANARTLWAFYQARYGAFESFNFFYSRVDTYVKEYVGTGDGSTTIFNLPSKDCASTSVYFDNVIQSSGFSITPEGGEDNCDKITFDTAPSTGVRMTFSFTGYLKIRARFAEMFLSFEVFYRVLTDMGIQLQGLLNDE